MTENYREGDKIRLTSKDAKVTLEGSIRLLQDRPCIDLPFFGWYGLLNLKSWYDIEVIEKAPVPLPTEPGIYDPGVLEGASTPANRRFLTLTTKGDWFWLDFTRSQSSTGATFDSAEYHIKSYAETMFKVFPTDAE